MHANLGEGDLRLLRVFAKVVEAGGFSAAQIELNVSQSTISTQMTALEHRLGLRLCQRGRAGFSLTEKGRLIYQASQRLFAAIDEFRSEAGAARGCLVGNLAVGIVDNLVNNPACRLHDVITRFNLRAPEVQIAVQVASPTEIERAVLEGRFDLGFGACGRHSPYLDYDDLFEERQALYCGAGHPLFARSGGNLGRRSQGTSVCAAGLHRAQPLADRRQVDLDRSGRPHGKRGGVHPVGALYWVPADAFCRAVGGAGPDAAAAGTDARLPEPDLSGVAQDRAEEADPHRLPGRTAGRAPDRAGTGAAEEVAEGRRMTRADR